MKHKFVEFIPAEPEEGIIYISMEYATATHLCPCGCKSKVITPITPIDWQLTFNGDSISLQPSVGNWRFPCRSHYFIKHNEVVWAGSFTDEQIQETHEYELDSHRKFYSKDDRDDVENQEDDEKKTSVFNRIFKRLFP